MSELFFLLVLLFFLFLLYKTYKNSKVEEGFFFVPALLLRILFGISLGLVYSYYYQEGDTFIFFEDAQKLASLSSVNFRGYLDCVFFGDDSVISSLQLSNEQFRSLFFVKILSVFLHCSFANYWVTTFYFSVISFFGSWYLFKVINKFYPKGIYASAIAFLLVPSVLFWSSGIIKETVAFAGILSMSALLLKTYHRDRVSWYEWVTFFLAAYFTWRLKYYWAALFFPCVVATWLTTFCVRITANKLQRFEVGVWIAIFGSLLLITSTLHPNFHFERFLAVIVDNNLAYEYLTQAPFIHFYKLEPTWTSILINSPWAMISGLYRPIVFESSTLFQFWIGVENAILVLLTILNLKYLSGIRSSPSKLIILSLLVYILLLAIFLSLSTPNFGTLSRYRVGFLPFFFFLLLYYPAYDLLNSRLKLK